MTPITGNEPELSGSRQPSEITGDEPELSGARGGFISRRLWDSVTVASLQDLPPDFTGLYIGHAGMIVFERGRPVLRI